MNLPIWLTSPVAVLLLRWTCLLALGWGVHGLLRHRHARWRLILWRGILCFGLALPLLHFLQVPGIKIPVTREATHIPEAAGSLPSQTIVNPIQPAPSQGQAPPPLVAPSSPARSKQTPNVLATPPLPPKQIPWGTVFLLIWALGCVSGAVRLLRLHWQLSRLRRGTSQPTPDLQRLAKQIQAQLNVRREPELRISEAVTSPFVCGLLRPAIVLPRMLMEQLSPEDLAALLTHEMAHLCHHDLLWSVAWRWLGAICWFHPLVWRIPAAHNLACDQEADRVASGQMAEQDSYSQSLARLALRVLALPAVETKLTLNGSSQIARRLIHLGRERTKAWNWRHSAAGIGLVGSLFLMTAAWGFTRTELLPAGGAPQSPEMERAAAADVPEQSPEINALATQAPGYQRLSDRDAIRAETVYESMRNLITNYPQFIDVAFSQGPRTHLETMLVADRARKVIQTVESLPAAEQERTCRALFDLAITAHTNQIKIVGQGRTNPELGSPISTLMSVCVAMFTTADLGLRGLLAEEFAQLDPVPSLVPSTLDSLARRATSGLAVPDNRFQLNLLRLAALRDATPGSQLLAQLEEELRTNALRATAGNTITNIVRVQHWAVWGASIVRIRGQPPPALAGGTPDPTDTAKLYEFLDWPGPIHEPADVHEKKKQARAQLILDLRGIVLAPGSGVSR
jgi:beta-lactamase regulating signal transducer with metallopeptidase domain